MDANSTVQVGQILRANAAVAEILKRRWPNTTTKETNEISFEIIQAVVKEFSTESK